MRDSLVCLTCAGVVTVKTLDRLVRGSVNAQDTTGYDGILVTFSRVPVFVLV